jgi:hypothetical protein
LYDSLRQALGAEALEDLVSWMDDVESAGHLRDSIRADFAEFRETIRGDFAQLRQRVEAIDAGLRQRIDAIDAGSRERDESLRGEIKNAKYDLIKWSFVFWVTAVASIAGLAKVLR